MVHAQHPTADRYLNRESTGFPLLAVLSAIGAGLAFAGVGMATRSLGGNPAGMVAGAVVMLTAGISLLAPATRAISLLLTWNGLGIAIGILVVGIFSVGALMAFPLALIAIALSSWPRKAGESVASGPAIVVQVSGFLLVLALYGVLDDPTSWLTGLW
ncbi:MAG TPA: hypothetical protein VD767_00425 [Thermomicrobiales bacterium]|nr:hypothetical protein [Thermomicrobiales bacterium]